MWICGSDDHKKVIAKKEGIKRTMESFNTSFNIRSIRSCLYQERFATWERVLVAVRTPFVSRCLRTLFGVVRR